MRAKVEEVGRGMYSLDGVVGLVRSPGNQFDVYLVDPHSGGYDLHETYKTAELALSEALGHLARFRVAGDHEFAYGHNPRSKARTSGVQHGCGKPYSYEMNARLLGDRISRIRKLAASQVKSSEAKSWLRMDERGLWEAEANKVYEQVSQHPDFRKYSEKEIDKEIASVLAFYAQEASLGDTRMGRRLRSNKLGAGSYWVWLVRKGTSEPLTSEGPYGPHDLQGARTFARIGATEGEHDRAVSQGKDPGAAGFSIVRIYRAGSGERVV
jgi:hypothetical protein